MTSEFIIDVTEADFEYNVISYSQQVPVVVDFWAEWCGPCKSIGPILEKLAEQGRGKFRLAKVNVDQNANLAMRYNIRSIPAVKAFRDGTMVAEFLGAQPEGKIREFIREIAPEQSDLKLEKGLSLLDDGNAAEAEICFNESLQISPESPRARLGLIRSLLMQGDGIEANELLFDFPPSPEYSSAIRLQPLAEALIQIDNEDSFEIIDEPLEAAFHNAIRLIKLGNIEAAMDGLLEVLRTDKHFHDNQARLIFVAILEVLGEKNPITRPYRRELASILF